MGSKSKKRIEELEDEVGALLADLQNWKSRAEVAEYGLRHLGYRYDAAKAEWFKPAVTREVTKTEVVKERQVLPKSASYWSELPGSWYGPLLDGPPFTYKVV